MATHDMTWHGTLFVPTWPYAEADDLLQLPDTPADALVINALVRDEAGLESTSSDTRVRFEIGRTDGAAFLNNGMTFSGVTAATSAGGTLQVEGTMPSAGTFTLTAYGANAKFIMTLAVGRMFHVVTLIGVFIQTAPQ